MTACIHSCSKIIARIACILEVCALNKNGIGTDLRTYCISIHRRGQCTVVCCITWCCSHRRGCRPRFERRRFSSAHIFTTYYIVCQLIANEWSLTRVRIIRLDTRCRKRRGVDTDTRGHRTHWIKGTDHCRLKNSRTIICFIQCATLFGLYNITCIHSILSFLNNLGTIVIK